MKMSLDVDMAYRKDVCIYMMIKISCIEYFNV